MDLKRNATTGSEKHPPGTLSLMQLKALLVGLWLYLLLDLAPQLEEAINNLGLHVPCPFHGGKDGFRLFSDAAETGGGVCNTCGSFADGIALLQWVNGWTLRQTLEAVNAWLAINRHQKPTEKAPSAGTGIDPKAKKIIDGIAKGVEDDPGRVAEYLRNRGLSGDIPEVIKFHKNLPLFEGGKQVGTLPAMVAPYQQADGQVVGYLRTYLDSKGPGKANIQTPKKNTAALWKGATRGAVIKLGDSGRVLGIAEGIETALAVWQATGITVWAAGSAGGMETAEFPEESSTIYILADNDKGGRGEDAAMMLAERLLREGRTVYVATPKEVGTDWLDVLNQHGEEGIREGLDEAVCYELAEDEGTTIANDDFMANLCLEGDPEKIVDELNRTHFIVNVGGKVCIANQDYDPQMDREALTFSCVSEFSLRYGNRFINSDTPIVKVWLTNPRRRQYKGIVFLPGREVDGYYNLFRGFPIEPIKGDCSLFWNHVHDHICSGNERHFKYLRGWMSHGIQFPQELPGTSIVLQGLQGTGKGVFVDNYGALFGSHFVSIYRLEQITGRFNSHQKNIILLHANEATCQGDKVGEGVLKGLITDPFVPVEHKGKDIINLRNFKRVIVSTNEDWAVSVGMDDRRYVVLPVSSEKKEDKVYFRAIQEQMGHGGLQALMYDLLNEDLTDFDVRTAPYCPSNFDQKLHSAPAIVQWWYDSLCEGSTSTGISGSTGNDWNQQPAHDHLYSAYTNWCRDSRMMTISRPIFGRKFRTLLPGVAVGESRRAVGSVDIDWAKGGKRQRCYVLPSLHECREAFQRFSKTGPEIWPLENQDD